MKVLGVGANRQYLPDQRFNLASFKSDNPYAVKSPMNQQQIIDQMNEQDHSFRDSQIE